MSENDNEEESIKIDDNWLTASKIDIYKQLENKKKWFIFFSY